MRSSARIPCLAVAFALSGAAALLAEQVFEKLLSTLVGATTPASAIVLSVYFAGLTAGALLYPAFLRRLSAVYVYPALELLVASACVVLMWKFDALAGSFAPLLRLGLGQPALLTLLRGVVAAAWILPLTIPMGATFPAIVDAVDELAPTSRARSVSVLYALNLFGAIVGAIGGPIVVFPSLGMGGGLSVAAAFDIVAALLALFVASSARRERVGRRAPSLEASPGTDRIPRELLALAATTGFILFALEVLWTHLACAVIGNSVYAFAAMLASVLIGLGLGSAVSALVLRRSPRVPAWAPGGALVAGALSLALLHPVWPLAPHAVGVLGGGATSFAGQELARFATAAGVLVPPAAVFGLAYPLLFRVPAFPESKRGGAAGRLAAVNAVGCIAGSLVTGFFVLPRFGSEATERGLMVLSAVAGIAATFSVRAMRRPILAAGAAALAAALLLPPWNRLALTSGEHVYFQPMFVKKDTSLLSFHEDTLGGINTVVGSQANGREIRTLLTNGKFQGNDEGEMVAQTSFALVPMQYVSHFDRALVIGLGTGRSAFAVHAMGFGQVDIAEIAPGIVDAARRMFPHVNHDVLGEPNVHLYLEDGRNLLLLREATYDLITIELTSVWFAGATNLYSREFYALAKSRLREGGVFQEWIQAHHLGLVELESVLGTVRAVFPYVSFFVLGGQGLVVASTSPQEVQPAFVAQLRERDGATLLDVSDDSAALRILASARVLAPADMDRFAELPGLRLNTDENRFIEYASPRYNYRHDDMREVNLTALAAMASFPPPPIAAGVDDRARAALARVESDRQARAQKRAAP